MYYILLLTYFLMSFILYYSDNNKCNHINLYCCLESSNLPRRPPLEVAVAHARELVNLMSRSGLGSCAFACVDDLLQH